MRADNIGPGVVATLSVACGLAVGAQSAALAAPLADAQGWSGPGWYITNMATPIHAYILFDGPHALQSRCVETYDRLYSPIGMCRFLDAKPIEPAR